MRTSVATIAVLLALPAQAQQAPLPKEAQAAIDEAKKDCGERVRLMSPSTLMRSSSVLRFDSDCSSRLARPDCDDSPPARRWSAARTR